MTVVFHAQSKSWDDESYLYTYLVWLNLMCFPLSTEKD